MLQLVKNRREFEAWLGNMDVAIGRFLDALPEDVRTKMDFSAESLDVLEAWLLQKYPTYSDLMESSERAIWDGVARYIGETYRKHLGGYWEPVLDPKYGGYRLPQLTGYSEKPTPICVHTLPTAALDRRTGQYLRTVLENVMRRKRRG